MTPTSWTGGIVIGIVAGLTTLVITALGGRAGVSIWRGLQRYQIGLIEGQMRELARREDIPRMLGAIARLMGFQSTALALMVVAVAIMVRATSAPTTALAAEIGAIFGSAMLGAGVGIFGGSAIWLSFYVNILFRPDYADLRLRALEKRIKKPSN